MWFELFLLSYPLKDVVVPMAVWLKEAEVVPVEVAVEVADVLLKSQALHRTGTIVMIIIKTFYLDHL